MDIIANNRHNNLRQILIDMLKALKQLRRMSHYCKTIVYYFFILSLFFLDELRELMAPFYPDLQ